MTRVRAHPKAMGRAQSRAGIERLSLRDQGSVNTKIGAQVGSGIRMRVQSGFMLCSELKGKKKFLKIWEPRAGGPVRKKSPPACRQTYVPATSLSLPAKAGCPRAF